VTSGTETEIEAGQQAEGKAGDSPLVLVDLWIDAQVMAGRTHSEAMDDLRRERLGLWEDWKTAVLRDRLQGYRSSRPKG
jgi:hypothetical protein